MCQKVTNEMSLNGIFYRNKPKNTRVLFKNKKITITSGLTRSEGNKLIKCQKMNIIAICINFHLLIFKN